MKTLVDRFCGLVKGVISGFDRIVFKGRILPLLREEGVESFCASRRILNRDYRDWMVAQSKALVEHVERTAVRETGVGITHLRSYRIDKEQTARQRQDAKGIAEGLVGVWSCQESGFSYRSTFQRGASRPSLRRYNTRCKHLYSYFDHARFGFMNVRLQTWFPYDIQVCMNGREWLRRSLQQTGVGFVMEGNKLLGIEDPELASELLRAQLNTEWRTLLDGFLPLVFPTMEQTLGPHLSYYWTGWQTEWASDLLFRSAADLERFREDLMRHAFMTGTSERVLRYLGRYTTAAGKPSHALKAEVRSRTTDFVEGTRVRHWVGSNSVKCYTERNVLRIETTMNDPTAFHAHRRAAGEPPDAEKKLRPLRKGVADMPLRGCISQEVNNRLADQLASFEHDTPLRDLLAPVTRRRVRGGRPIRAIQPAGKDRELLEAIADPRFAITGMNNAELRERLRASPWGAGRTDRQLAGRVTRHLRLLRDHGLIRKVKNRRRYHLTTKGHNLTTALVASLHAPTKKLMDLAA